MGSVLGSFCGSVSYALVLLLWSAIVAGLTGPRCKIKCRAAEVGRRVLKKGFLILHLVFRTKLQLNRFACCNEVFLSI